MTVDSIKSGTVGRTRFMTLVRSLLLVASGYAAALATPAVAGQLSTVIPVDLSWSVAGKSSMKGVVVGQPDADITVTEQGKNTIVSLSPGGSTLCVVTVPNDTPMKFSASNEPGTGYELAWKPGKKMTATRTIQAVAQ